MNTDLLIDKNTEDQAETFETGRVTVPELESILYQTLPVLDHGFIRVVDYMGTDASIVQAARVSYGKGTKQVRKDAGLINYLLRHRHTTPFEMCEIKLHIKLPIFIARQWVRHRTANINEYSARYSILDKEFYIPPAHNIAAQSILNNQGRADTPIPADQAAEVMELLKRDAMQCYDTYQKLLNHDAQGNIIDESKSGVARELARMNLNLNFYTQWYWKIDLHNLMHFLALRVDEHAQYEIREYAQVMLDILKRWVPLSYEAFMNYQVGAVPFSKKALSVVKKLIRQEPISQEDSGLSAREWRELMASLEMES